MMTDGKPGVSTPPEIAGRDLLRRPVARHQRTGRLRPRARHGRLGVRTALTLAAAEP
jgi:hypothetical protein